MDHLLGIVGKDFVLVATDMKVAHSVVALKTDQDKIYTMDSHKVLAGGGQFGDVDQFAEYVRRNMVLYAMRNGFPLSTHATAHYTRQEIARLIRSNPHQCNMLLGGWDADTGPELYWLDYIGNMQKLNAAAHGYGGYFSLSIMDREYHDDMSFDEAVALMKKCFEEINTRFLIGGADFILKCVDKDGVRVVPL